MRGITAFRVSRLAVALVMGLLSLAGCRSAPITHDVTTEAKPWTAKPFRGDSTTLQFAIVADRASSPRPGIFESAVEKLNLLQPEFVMSVGDLIQGNTEDPDDLALMKDELDSFVNALDMPFFYLPGNHDIANDYMSRQWEKTYGRRYYSFVRKDVLFICLDTSRVPRRGNDEIWALDMQTQMDWAREVLLRNPGVRWTFLFMHHPLWVLEEEAAEGNDRAPGFTSFPKLQEALASRDYTIFAGHFHEYTKYVRDGHKYFILSTTGGGSRLTGPAFGSFDGIVWVSMTGQGPRIANLQLEGIHDEDINAEQDMLFIESPEFREFADSLKFQTSAPPSPSGQMTFTLPVRNTLNAPLRVRLSWECPHTSGWAISPDTIEATLAPGENAEWTFTADCNGELLPIAKCRGEFLLNGKPIELMDEPPPCDMDAYLAERLPKILVARASSAAVIDGDLDDALWQRPPDAERFWATEMDRPDAATRAWMAFDEDSLYLAVKCDEPNMDRLGINNISRDSSVWRDDSIEWILDTNQDQETFYQFAINVSGAAFDAETRNASYNPDIRVATTRSDESWSMELAIPWKDLELSAAPDSTFRFALIRNRPQKNERYQFPLLNGANHNFKNYGELRFAP